MMCSPMDNNPPLTASLQGQINALGKRMDCGFSEVKALLQGIDARVRALEKQEAGYFPVLQNRLDSACHKLDAHDAAIDVIEKEIVALKRTNQLLSWLGGLLGSALILWLVAQLLEGVG